MPKLSDEQIKQRLQEGRNYKHLYRELKGRFDEVTAEHKQCPQLLAEQQAAIETLKLQVAELQTMVFGKKKRPPTGTPAPVADVMPKQTLPRTKDSYRRSIPPATAITAEVSVSLPETCACSGSFKDVTTHDRYEEDIPLPDLTKDYQARLVTKYRIERGVCTACGKTNSGRDLGGQTVRLGSNVRLLVCHLVSMMGLSYAQIIQLCASLYALHLTDGEIAAIVRKQHVQWLPAYEQLQADIRASPAVHADETSWPIQYLEGHGYAWVLAASDSSKSCFALENSRGARHAQKLLDNYAGVRITDDYGVYRSLPGLQQLCWAHLYRCIRDLRYNENLPEAHLAYVSWWYEQFAGIYQQLRIYLAEPYDRVQRQTQADDLWHQLQRLCGEHLEPAKLTSLKAQLKRVGQDRLFICLVKDTPCDNNRAERDLRPLVLKRKRSFGSKSEKGAQALATVLSICTTTWRSHPNGYFQALGALG